MAVAVGGVVFNVALNATGVQTGTQIVVRNLNAIQNTVNKTQTSINNTNKSFEQFGNTLSTIASGLATGLALDTVKEYALLAARVESLGTVLDNVGTIAGKNRAQLSILEDRVKGLGITTQAARQSIILLAQSELELEKSTQLARIAQDAAVIANTNSSEAFQRLVLAVQRGDSRLLRNLGIVVNLAQVYQDYAVSVGRTVNTLTPLEKRQLIYNEVLKKGALIQGTYEASLSDVNKQFTSLARYIEEAQVAIGKNFLPAFRLLVTEATAFSKEIGDNKTYARFSSNILAAGAAVGVLGTAILTLKGAFGALAALGGPIGAVLAAAGFAAFVLQDAAASAEQYGESLDEARLAQERFVQTSTDATKALKEVDRLLKIPSKFQTAGELVKIRSELDKIAKAFPSLAKSFKSLDPAVDQLRIQKALTAVPQQLITAEQAQARLNSQLEVAIKTVAKFYNISEERSRQFIEQKIAEEKSLNSVFQDIDSRLKTRQSNFLLALDIPGFNKLTKYKDDVRLLGHEISSLLGLVSQLQRVEVDSTFEEFSQGADNIGESAREAENLLKLLATERRKLFKETNAEIIDDFETFLSKQRALTLLTKEQIEAYVKSDLRRSVIQVREQTAGALKAEQDAQKRRKLVDDANSRIQDLEKQSTYLERVKELTDRLAKSEEGLGAAVELANLQLEQQAEAISALEDEVIGLERGLDEDLVRAQKRFEKSLITNTALLKRYNAEILEIKKAGADALSAGNEKEAERQSKLLTLTEAARAQAIEDQQLRERKLVAETVNIRRQKLEQYAEREKQLLQDIAELRGTTALNVLSSVEQLAEAQKEAREETSKFLREQKLGLVDPSGQVTKFLSFVEDFQNNIAKARPDQLNLIKKIFPQAERAVLRDINRALEDIDRRTQRFSEDFEERVANINIEAENIRKSKLDEGATFERSNAAAEKFRRRAFEDLERERQLNEEATAANVTAKAELKTQQLSGDKSIKALLENRKQVLEREAELGLTEKNVQEQLLILKSEKVAKAQEELAFTQQQTEELKKQTELTNQLLQNSAARTSATGQPRSPAARLFDVAQPIEEFRGAALQEIEARNRVQEDLLRTPGGDSTYKATQEIFKSIDGHLSTISEKIGGQGTGQNQDLTVGFSSLANYVSDIGAGSLQNRDSVNAIRERIDREAEAFRTALGAKFRGVTR